MKKSVVVISVLFYCLSAFCQTKIPIESVSKYMGQKVTVCSKVYGIKSLEKVSFINLGASYPNSLLTIVIFARDKANFKEPLETYSDKNICVTGVLKEYNGKPEIIISNPADITSE
jgi:DNA/RNA endonuclease YhcR with UshA esterase domain